MEEGSTGELMFLNTLSEQNNVVSSLFNRGFSIITNNDYHQ